MHPIARYAVCSALVALSATPALAGFQPGPYHGANCTGCHDSSVYTRANRRVQSYQALEAQVARCDAQLATKLFPDDLALLVDYLNDQYYGFKK